jgi:thiamine biosynthesis lipoprotein
MKKTAAYLLFLALVFILSCGQQGQRTFKKSTPLMDTLVAITVVSYSAGDAEKAIDHALSSIEAFGEHINFFSETSELSGLNRNAGIRRVRVSPDTLDVIEKAVFVSERSDGAYDPTIGPVMRLYDFQEKKKPPDDDIRKALPLVDYRDIIISRSDSTVFLRKKGMLLDLGGIAKGYAADLAVQSLKKDGISAGLVAIAGDIRTFGVRSDGKAWTIGIKNPRQKGEKDEVVARISLVDKAISTSGDYERYFMSDGQRYHHILNPKTGYPESQCMSATVISESAVYSDAFSTALFTLGPEKGLKLAKEQKMEAVIIDSHGKVHVTDAMKELLTIEKDTE